jgi:hypothetical protein
MPLKKYHGNNYSPDTVALYFGKNVEKLKERFPKAWGREDEWSKSQVSKGEE